MDRHAGLTQLGPYPILAVLGSGGMGTVYLALHRGVGGFEKKVAIKALLPHVADDKQFVRMLVEEAKLTAQLTHPNIVQVIDLATSGQTHYLVMEYVEGVDVRTLSEHQELSLDEAVYLVSEAARGLAYAHRKCGPNGEMLSVVHRDVSGHNLLVSLEGITKVMDFGIAKAASNRGATEVGVLKGKLAYMSPEQALGRNLDARSDLFSLGIVLWELCTRQRLFAGDTEMQILLKVQRCEIEPPSRFVDGFPRELESIVLKCLAVNPEHRYADGDRLADELQGFLGSNQGAIHPRVKLAQRVQDYLRGHPLPQSNPTSSVAPEGLGIEKTLASVRDDSTRLVSSDGREKPTRKKTRRPLVALAASVFLGLAGTALWLAARQGTTSSASPVSPVAAKLPVRGVHTLAVQAEQRPEKSAPAPAVVSAPSAALAPPASLPRIAAGTAATVKRKLQALQAAVSRPAPPSVPAKVEAQPASRPAEGGFLSLNATPWARVYIDGVSVAESTPLLKYALSSGDHSVVLVNPELKVRKEIQLSVLPGEHLRRKINLE